MSEHEDTTERCGTCRYYKGECRRFPPQYTPRGSGKNFYYPEVSHFDWCGEWYPKPEERPAKVE